MFKFLKDKLKSAISKISEGVEKSAKIEDFRDTENPSDFPVEGKAEEKEAERLERERLREERKVQQEIERERARLEKERQHYTNALEALIEKGDEAGVARIREELKEVERAIADVDYRAANIRAGYVYVISNIGSFGERMVKIGMTRRLDPMDRTSVATVFLPRERSRKKTVVSGGVGPEFAADGFFDRIGRQFVVVRECFCGVTGLVAFSQDRRRNSRSRDNRSAVGNGWVDENRARL